MRKEEAAPSGDGVVGALDGVVGKTKSGRPSHTAPLRPPAESLEMLTKVAGAAAKRARVRIRHQREASDLSEPLLGGPFSLDHVVVVSDAAAASGLGYRYACFGDGPGGHHAAAITGTHLYVFHKPSEQLSVTAEKMAMRLCTRGSLPTIRFRLTLPPRSGWSGPFTSIIMLHTVYVATDSPHGTHDVLLRFSRSSGESTADIAKARSHKSAAEHVAVFGADVHLCFARPHARDTFVDALRDATAACRARCESVEETTPATESEEPHGAETWPWSRRWHLVSLPLSAIAHLELLKRATTVQRVVRLSGAEKNGAAAIGSVAALPATAAHSSADVLRQLFHPRFTSSAGQDTFVGRDANAAAASAALQPAWQRRPWAWSWRVNHSSSIADVLAPAKLVEGGAASDESDLHVGVLSARAAWRVSEAAALCRANGDDASASARAALTEVLLEWVALARVHFGASADDATAGGASAIYAYADRTALASSPHFQLRLVAELVALEHGRWRHEKLRSGTVAFDETPLFLRLQAMSGDLILATCARWLLQSQPSTTSDDHELGAEAQRWALRVLWMALDMHAHGEFALSATHPNLVQVRVAETPGLARRPTAIGAFLAFARASLLRDEGAINADGDFDFEWQHVRRARLVATLLEVASDTVFSPSEQYTDPEAVVVKETETKTKAKEMEQEQEQKQEAVPAWLDHERCGPRKAAVHPQSRRVRRTSMVSRPSVAPALLMPRSAPLDEAREAALEAEAASVWKGGDGDDDDTLADFIAKGSSGGDSGATPSSTDDAASSELSSSQPARANRRHRVARAVSRVSYLMMFRKKRGSTVTMEAARDLVARESVGAIVAGMTSSCTATTAANERLREHLDVEAFGKPLVQPAALLAALEVFSLPLFRSASHTQEGRRAAALVQLAELRDVMKTTMMFVVHGRHAMINRTALLTCLSRPRVHDIEHFRAAKLSASSNPMFKHSEMSTAQIAAMCRTFESDPNGVGATSAAAFNAGAGAQPELLSASSLLPVVSTRVPLTLVARIVRRLRGRADEAGTVAAVRRFCDWVELIPSSPEHAWLMWWRSLLPVLLHLPRPNALDVTTSLIDASDTASDTSGDTLIYATKLQAVLDAPSLLTGGAASALLPTHRRRWRAWRRRCWGELCAQDALLRTESGIDPGILEHIGAEAFAAEAENIAAQSEVVELALGWANTLFMHGFIFGVGADHAVAMVSGPQQLAEGATRGAETPNCALATAGATIPVSTPQRLPLAVTFEAMLLVMIDELALYQHSRVVAAALSIPPSARKSVHQRNRKSSDCVSMSELASKLAIETEAEAEAAQAPAPKVVVAPRSAWDPVAVELARSMLLRVVSNIENVVGKTNRRGNRGGADWKNLDTYTTTASAAKAAATAAASADGSSDCEGVHWQSLLGLLHVVELFVVCRPAWYSRSQPAAEDQPLHDALNIALGTGGDESSASAVSQAPATPRSAAVAEGAVAVEGLAGCSQFSAPLRQKGATSSSLSSHGSFWHRPHTVGTYVPLDLDIMTSNHHHETASSGSHALRNCEAYDRTLPPLPVAAGEVPAPLESPRTRNATRRVGVHITAPPPPPGWPWSTVVEGAGDWSVELPPARPQRASDAKCCQDTELVSTVIRVMRAIGFGTSSDEWQHKTRKPKTTQGIALLRDCSAALLRFEAIASLLTSVESLAWAHYERRYTELGQLYAHSVATPTPRATFGRLIAASDPYATTDEMRAIRECVKIFLITGSCTVNPIAGRGQRKATKSGRISASRDRPREQRRSSDEGVALRNALVQHAEEHAAAEAERGRRPSNLFSMVSGGHFGEGKHRAALMAQLRKLGPGGSRLSSSSSTSSHGEREELDEALEELDEADEAEEADSGDGASATAVLAEIEGIEIVEEEGGGEVGGGAASSHHHAKSRFKIFGKRGST